MKKVDHLFNHHKASKVNQNIHFNKIQNPLKNSPQTKPYPQTKVLRSVYSNRKLHNNSRNPSQAKNENKSTNSLNKYERKTKKNSKRDEQTSLSKNIYTSSNKVKTSKDVMKQNEKFWKTLKKASFQDPQSLKLKLLGYIFKNRIVKDSHFNMLYEQLVEKFPAKEEVIRNLMVELVSTLDA